MYSFSDTQLIRLTLNFHKELNKCRNVVCSCLKHKVFHVFHCFCPILNGFTCVFGFPVLRSGRYGFLNIIKFHLAS